MKFRAPRSVVVASMLVLASAAISLGIADATSTPNTFDQKNLVADQPGVAQFTDPNLVNPWGIASGPATPLRVADNHSGVSTSYLGFGVTIPPTVTIPSPTAGDTSAPTGVVYNDTQDFKLNGLFPAQFIYATEDGTIAAWNPLANPTQATIKVDRSGAHAIFKGIAIGKVGISNFVYATDFHNGTVNAWDKNFVKANLAGNFIDPTIPTGFAPFNIANINDKLYVTYAKQDADKEDDARGPGNGFVDVFDTSGHFIRRLVSQGNLNSPWGLVVAPAGFGTFGGQLLVGNFGDGKINAYDLITGSSRGTLMMPNHTPVVIPNLWGVIFGNGALAGDRNKLYFTAGPNREEHGLFGVLSEDTNPFTK